MASWPPLGARSPPRSLELISHLLLSMGHLGQLGNYPRSSSLSALSSTSSISDSSSLFVCLWEQSQHLMYYPCVLCRVCVDSITICDECLSVSFEAVPPNCVRRPQRCELHFTAPPIWSLIQIYKSSRCGGTNPKIFTKSKWWSRETDPGVKKSSLAIQFEILGATQTPGIMVPAGNYYHC